MAAKYKKLAILFFCLFTAPLANAQDAYITGEWAAQDRQTGLMMTLQFNNDGTWIFDKDGNMVEDMWGKYKIKGDRLTVTSMGGAALCPLKKPGTYTIQHNGPQLTFIEISDGCAARSADFSLFWTQQ